MKRKTKAHKPGDPVNVSALVWYYEEPRGLNIVHEIRHQPSGDYYRTDQILIPWKLIEASRERRMRKLAADKRTAKRIPVQGVRA